MRPELLEQLRAIVSGNVSAGGSLREYTTYLVGGAAEALVHVSGPEDIERACRFAFQHRIPLTVIGAGSNVIVPDSGIDGIVVRTLHLSSFPVKGRRVVVSAGTMLDDLIRGAAAHGLGGLAPLAGIPGTVGGALVMNAGTDSGTIADRLEDVTVLDRAGIRETIPAARLSFGYRTSPFAAGGAVILSATFLLEPDREGDILAALDDVSARRRRSYPLERPSAGSVFRRPPGDYPGRLIELAGCKGMRIGGAMVSELHANFIVNMGDATAADILALIEAVRERVREVSGVRLELEQIPLPRTPGRPNAL